MGSKKVDNILTVRGLFKQYQKRSAIVKAVDNVDFEINKGEIVGLIGESGSGKTTLSRLVTRLEEPTFGEIIFNNNLISKPRLKKSEKHDLYSKMQMIFQNPYSSLNDRFNLINIISEPIRVTKKIDEEVEFLSSNEKELEKTYAKTLSIFYHTNYELTRETINKMELEAMQDTINRVDEINKNFLDIDINETLTAFFEIFEKKFDYNSKIIDNLSDLLNTLDNNFRLALKNLKNNVITKDEQELFEARKSLETFKKYNAELPFVYHELGVLRDDLTQLVKDQKAELENRVHEQKRLLSGIMDQIKRLIAKQTHAISLSKTLLENVAATLKRDMLRTYLKFIEIRYKSFNSFDLTTIENIDIEILKVIDDISAKLVMSFDKTMYDSKKHRVLIIDKANRNFYKVAKEKIDSALKTYSDPKIEEYKKNVSRLKQNIEYLAKVSHTPDTIEENRKILVKLQENYEKAKQDYNYEAKRFDELIFLPAVAQNNKVKRKNDIAHQKLDGVAKTASRRIYTLNKRLERAVFDFYRSSLNRGKEIDYTAKTFKSTFKEKNTQDNALKYEVKALVELLTNSVQQSYLIKKRGPNYKSNLKKVLIRSKVFDILKQVGLKSSHAYRYPHEFSGGQRQRIAIARALISEPELLIADEPIAALDVSIQAQIVNLLVDLAKKRNFSMLFIAHDLAMVNHIADRIYIMHKGIIVEKGNTKLIFEKPAHPYTKRLMESMPSIDNVNQEFEEIPDLDDYRSGYLKNPPRFYQINNESKNHFVFGNNEQFDEWTK